jgi:pimeloyl-ACP methyl ester carboxylesterase
VLPQARVLEIEGAGHQPFVEATARLAEVIFGGVADVRKRVGA